MKISLGEIRNRMKMSTRELSEKSGVARSHIQKIEAGEAIPTVEVACKLAKVLGVSLEELVSCD